MALSVQHQDHESVGSTSLRQGVQVGSATVPEGLLVHPFDPGATPESALLRKQLAAHPSNR